MILDTSAVVAIFTYATALLARRPLPCVGGDFRRTNLPLA